MNLHSVFNRAKNLLINPQEEWILIESEHTSRKQLIKSYVIPFVVLIAICSFIGSSFLSLQPYSFNIVIVKVLITSFLLIGGVYLSSIIINELTVSFRIAKDLDNTFKLVTYSFTSFFIVSCISGLLPDLSILAILGLHSVYLFWLGTTSIMKATESSKAGFVLVSFLINIGIYAIFSLIVDTVVDGMLYVSQPLLR